MLSRIAPSPQAPSLHDCARLRPLPNDPSPSSNLPWTRPCPPPRDTARQRGSPEMSIHPAAGGAELTPTDGRHATPHTDAGHTHTHRHTHAATWHLPHAAATPSGSHGTDPAIHIFAGDTNQHLVPPNDGWVSDSGFAAQFTSPVGTVPALSATRTHQRTVPAACTAAPPDASVPQRAEHTPDATSAAQVASRAPLPAAQMLSKNPPTAAPPTAARAPQGCTPSIGHGSQGPMDWIDGSTLSKGIHPCSPARPSPLLHDASTAPYPAGSRTGLLLQTSRRFRRPVHGVAHAGPPSLLR